MSKWMICPTCSGEGSHSLRLGVINRDEWSDDEFSDYMGGAYDEPCNSCNSTGKITADRMAEIESARSEFSETRWLPGS